MAGPRTWVVEEEEGTVEAVHGVASEEAEGETGDTALSELRHECGVVLEDKRVADGWGTGEVRVMGGGRAGIAVELEREEEVEDTRASDSRISNGRARRHP